MLELAKFMRGNLSYYLGMFLISPWLISMKLGLVSKTNAKEKFLTYFFGDTSIENFTIVCNNFCEKLLPYLIRDDAMKAIEKHVENKTLVVIVSASAENWVAPWCLKHNIQFICTQLVVENGKINGKLNGKNCNGNEKVDRIKARFNLSDFSTIDCYGDTPGDYEMLQLATRPHYRVFTH